jgi:hypothetical protein
MKEETSVKDTAAALADDEKRAQEAKQEKLRNAESIDMAAAAGGSGPGKGATEEGWSRLMEQVGVEGWTESMCV